MKLPVFKVASTIAPAERIRDLGDRLFPREDHEIVERGTLVELRGKTGAIEVDVGKGGLWGNDSTRLWRFRPNDSQRRNLIGGSEARKRALELLTSQGILPDLAAPFRLRSPKVTGAVTAYAPEKNGRRQTIKEDTTVLAEMEVDASAYGAKKPMRVVGGGGRFGVVFGEHGRLLGVRGVWRPPVGKPTQHEVISQNKADEIFRKQTVGVSVADYSSELAYYAAPAFAEQELLYPVYVYTAVAKLDKQRVPLRKILIPATEVGPMNQPGEGQLPRTKDGKPRVRPLPADFRPVPGKPLPPGIALSRRLMRSGKAKLTDFFLPSVNGDPLIVKPGLTPVKIKELANLLGFYSAGTSWIGLSGGLGGSQNNAKGFVDGLAASGWDIRFNWGDANAWESDWRRNDDTWVDAVDFVFYTGHANSDGWVLSAPDDDFLHFSETAGAADLWGQKNLEWAVVAACGPLQDEVVGSGGDVLDRWRNAFDGLHILMGYAQVTYDNEEEGKRLAQYAKNGSTIIQSWFRTGQEIQPEGIWVGAYYLGDAHGSTGDDHLWGVGSVGPDVTNPTWRACSWVPC
jgi:hypothetical protein